jgi:hypothetical protein
VARTGGSGCPCSSAAWTFPEQEITATGIVCEVSDDGIATVAPSPSRAATRFIRNAEAEIALD